MPNRKPTCRVVQVTNWAASAGRGIIMPKSLGAVTSDGLTDKKICYICVTLQEFYLLFWHKMI